ncbi:MAG TPA: fibronectin type III domain-containing protein, partial [Candidatus Saccharimonadales bacterium]|nr:fibronectin type III domain-containing protein [Candidatus Saccharimonadales bacterium]
VMVGDVVSTRDRTVITYDTQNALDRIEQDTRLSTQFLVTSGTQTSPQGSDSNFTGTAAFTNTNSLILSELATDKNPADPSRALVYFVNQPNPCGATQRFNRVLLTKVIYFIKSGSLWRRTIVPDNNTNSTPDNNSVCTSPWQLDSCSPGYVASLCKTNDEEVMKNIYSMSVGYYTDADSTVDQGAANALTANTIGVTIVAKKSVAGRDIDNTGTMRATKLNSIDTTLAAPTAPSVSHTLATPNNVQFNWTASPTATSYQVAYQINGGTWISQTLDANTLTYTVTGNRNDVINFKIAAFNGGGGSAYTTDTQTLPAWASLSLQHNWENYSTSYNSAGFTKTNNGRVFLKGLIKNGDVTNGTVIATLPEGYRPEGKLAFQTITSPNTEARIDVTASGDILLVTGLTNWISLDSISFLPSTQPYTWTNATYLASTSPVWTNWGSPYENVRTTRDSVGRVNMQGLAKAGNNATNTTIATQTSAYYPVKPLHFPAGASGFGEFWVWSDGDIVKRGTQTSSYLGLNALYYPTTVGTWTTITPNSPWVNYNIASGTYPVLACTKASDDVVTIRGLIKGGSVTGGTVMATLPAACPAPDKQTAMVAASYDDTGRVDIMPNGDLTLRLGNTNWFALNMSYVAN